MCLNFLKTPNSTNSYENCFSLHIPLAFHHISKYVPSFEARKSHVAIPLPSRPAVARPGHAFELASVALELLCGLAEVRLEVIDGLGLFGQKTQDIEYEQKQQINHVVINPDIR